MATSARKDFGIGDQIELLPEFSGPVNRNPSYMRRTLGKVVGYCRTDDAIRVKFYGRKSAIAIPVAAIALVEGAVCPTCGRGGDL